MQWKNPETHKENPIRVFGYNVEENILGIPMTLDPNPLNRMADYAVFDATSRPKFGSILESLERHENYAAEVNGRRIEVTGQTKVGVAFEFDGNLFTGEANFLRLVPNRSDGAIDLAALTVVPGADVKQVATELSNMLGVEAQVLTKEEFIEMERTYLSKSAPIDFIFLLGAAVGLFVGGVVIYQILYTDVMNNLPQYATLKAMGFSDNYLLMIVINECLVMSLSGFIPGFLIASWVCGIAAKVTYLPVHMTLDRSSLVLFLTTAMCCIAAVIVMGKLRKADPADVF